MATYTWESEKTCEDFIAAVKGSAVEKAKFPQPMPALRHGDFLLEHAEGIGKLHIHQYKNPNLNNVRPDLYCEVESFQNGCRITGKLRPPLKIRLLLGGMWAVASIALFYGFTPLVGVLFPLFVNLLTAGSMFLLIWIGKRGNTAPLLQLIDETAGAEHRAE